MTTWKQALVMTSLLGAAACSGPTKPDPAMQPVESMPIAGDAGSEVPEAPSESTTPERDPGAMRRARPLDVAQALRDAGVGGGGGTVRDAGGGGGGDAGVGGGGVRDAGVGGGNRDGGIGGGADAGVGRPR